MESEKQQPRGPIFSMGLGSNHDGEPGVIFMIAPTSFIENCDGEPTPGICIPRGAAREAAYALLLYAQQLENGYTAGSNYREQPKGTEAG